MKKSPSSHNFLAVSMTTRRHCTANTIIVRQNTITRRCRPSLQRTVARRKSARDVATLADDFASSSVLCLRAVGCQRVDVLGIRIVQTSSRVGLRVIGAINPQLGARRQRPTIRRHWLVRLHAATFACCHSLLVRVLISWTRNAFTLLLLVLVLASSTRGARSS